MGSTTAWTGKFLADGSGDIYIYALWYLSAGDDTVPIWQSFSAG